MIHFRLVTLYLSIILQISVLVAAFDLTIIHTNDCHARYEQTNKYTGACSEEQASQQECYGGYARLKTKVSDIRANYDNVLLLDAGDQYQGTLWFYYFGGTVTSYFMNLLGYDIMVSKTLITQMITPVYCIDVCACVCVIICLRTCASHVRCHELYRIPDYIVHVLPYYGQLWNLVIH